MLLTNLLDGSKAKLILLLPALTLLTACASSRPVEPTVVVQSEYVEQNIPIQARPKAVEFPPVDWYIITEENLDEKIAEIRSKTGNIVIFGITPKGYENLAIGIGDLRRYIKESQSIIAYYEEALTDEPEVEAPAESTD